MYEENGKNMTEEEKYPSMHVDEWRRAIEKKERLMDYTLTGWGEKGDRRRCKINVSGGGGEEGIWNYHLLIARVNIGCEFVKIKKQKEKNGKQE